VSPEAERYLQKARKCLSNARAILAIGLGEEAGRDAYLAGFHAAQAFLFESTGKVAKTHNGVHSQFVNHARSNSNIPPDMLTFLSYAYHFKAVADYETGPEASVPVEKAAAVIEAGERFLDCIAGVLATYEKKDDEPK
jgi:uncharacterized protein (UPF0332 family)